MINIVHATGMCTHSKNPPTGMQIRFGLNICSSQGLHAHPLRAAQDVSHASSTPHLDVSHGVDAGRSCMEDQEVRSSWLLQVGSSGSEDEGGRDITCTGAGLMIY